MFAESLLEVTWAQRSRRSWTTLTSFGLQAAVISLLLLLPLLKTVGLPGAPASVSTPVIVGSYSGEPAQTPRTGSASQAPSNPAVAHFVAPGRVPHGIPRGADEPSDQPPTGIGNGPEGTGLPWGDPNGLHLPIPSGTRPVLLPAPPTIAHTFLTSNLLEGSLIRRVLPIYPSAAKLAHIQGTVLLAATISKAGTIDDLHVLSGHPLLAGAAIEAVRQWRYRPYILNREPVEVETQITVKFVLSQD
jgi:protein TonB